MRLFLFIFSQILIISGSAYAENSSLYSTQAIEFVNKAHTFKSQLPSINGIKGMALVGSISTTTLSIEHRALVNYAKKDDVDYDLEINDTFDSLLKKFKCSTCIGEDDKSSILSDLIVQADELGSSVKFASKADLQTEEAIQEKLTQILGINANRENINLLKFVVAQSFLVTANKAK